MTVRVLLICLLLLVSPWLSASTGGVALDKVDIQLQDREAIKRGAKLFVSYCLNCHSAAYMRYNRLGQDLGMTDEEVAAELILTGSKVGDTMTVSMAPEDAKRWFGTVPPDLSVISRARGTDWLYTYLRSFYLDDSRPFGVNNLVLKNASMPHVLWELQGWQNAVYKEGEKTAAGDPVFDRLELDGSGKLSSKQYDKVVLDIVNFLVYVGEPVQLQRKQLGLWVLAFLAVFFVVAYMLKKEYWKDVH